GSHLQFSVRKGSSLSSIDAFLRNYIDRGHAPSVQYAFFDDSNVHHQFRYGYCNVGRELAIGADASYHIFSITKTVTALAVLQLVEQGRLKVNDAVSDYLNDFPYPSAITVDQLLSHTSGIPNPIPLRWTHLVEEHATFDADHFFDSIFAANPKLAFN